MRFLFPIQLTTGALNFRPKFDMYQFFLIRPKFGEGNEDEWNENSISHRTSHAENVTLRITLSEMASLSEHISPLWCGCGDAW